MLYHAYQTHSDLTSPLRLMAMQQAGLFWLQKTEGTLLRKMSAAAEVMSRMRLTHSRPAYGIAAVQVAGEAVPVVEEVTLSLPFGTLLRFGKPGVKDQPRVLLVAPLSGHFATLLRETARTLLQDHDVYITDWHNARDVSLRHGGFGLDDYTDHLMQFMAAIGPGAHMVAVCQPCVA
ncbi:MAG: polyhydroxyalkanoate depolymerase, partial [Ramlibacter sp.]